METLIILFLTFLFTTLNMLPVFLGALTIPQDSYFIGITHWYEDFFFYLSHLSQGADGLWQTRNWYTGEVLPPNPGWWTNIVLGKIGALLALDPWVTYRTALFFLSLILILTIYLVCKKLFPDNRLLRMTSFILTLSATSLFQITQTASGLTITPYTFFFTTTLAFNRLGGTVHQMMANILSLVLLLLASKGIEKILHNKPLSSYILCLILLPIISFLLTMLQPMAGVIVSGSTGLTLFILLIQKKSTALFQKLSFVELLIVLPVIPVCYTFLMLSHHPFYEYTLKVFEGAIPPANALTLFLSIGIIILFLPFGILSFVRKKSVLTKIGIIYATLPFLLYLSPIPRIMGIQYSRILQSESHVFLSAIAVLGIWTLAQWVNQKTSIKKPLIFTLFFSLILLVITPTLIVEVKGKIQAGKDFQYLSSIPKTLYDGLTFLKREPFGIAFAPYMESQFVPIVSHKPVFAGHRTMTIDYAKKIKDMEAFFTLQWDEKKAEEFFKGKNIRYIILPEGVASQKNVASLYGFLTSIYSTESLGIFTLPPRRWK